MGNLTNLDVSTPSLVLKLTDPGLSEYPFAYIAEPGSLSLSDAEIATLRKYLNGGGFLMADDFWGTDEWENLRTVMKQVFPDPMGINAVFFAIRK